MRLLCVNDKPIPGKPFDPRTLSLIKEGQDYDGEVTKGFCKGEEIDCYYLPVFNKKYHIERFTPLSDLDETELVTEEFEEKYCVPVNNPR